MEIKCRYISKRSKIYYISLLFILLITLHTYPAVVHQEQDTVSSEIDVWVDRKPSIDPDLLSLIQSIGSNDNIDVIISFMDNNAKLGFSRLILQLDPGAYIFEELPMIRAVLPKWFLQILINSQEIVSIYLNKKLEYFLRESTELINATKVWEGIGSPKTCGAGVGVAVIDTGADQTHPDLRDAVVVNVKIVNNVVINATGLNTDLTSGHGTHVAGIVGGRGIASQGYYRGVAPCVNIISISAGEALFILTALQAFDWVIKNYKVYNIRVISNSWGTTATNIDPWDPINLASYEAYRRGIVVVFAAGNSGPRIDTLNKYSIVPWVIGVAAGTKEGELAYFSSRGVPGHIFKKPTITAPGVDIVSARTSTIAITATDPNPNPVNISWTIYYASLSGTSMATPHVSGVVALMLSVNPNLSPDQVKDILTSTATPMPGYGEFEAGAGYINAQAAVYMASITKGELPSWKPRWSPEKLQEYLGMTIYTGDLLPSQRIIQGTAPPGERVIGILGGASPRHNVSISPFYSIVPIKVVAELSWTLATCDLDLAVYDPSGNLIAYSGALLGPESLEFYVNRVYGNYTFEIVVWLCPAPTPYTLNVTILYGDPRYLKIIGPKPMIQKVPYDLYITTPRIFKVIDGVGIASTYFRAGDSAFVRFSAFYINGSPAPSLNLTVSFIHDTGVEVYSSKARDLGGGSYQVDLSFNETWPSGRYLIVIRGPYSMVADKSNFYLNWLGVFIKPHTRILSPGSILTLYLRTVTLNSVGPGKLSMEPVAATYKIYINGSLTDFAIDTILNEWVAIQVKLPQTQGFLVIRIEASYSEPLTNIYWRGFVETWVVTK
ncbi:MAG: S8 family serine peptidase [Sulfolobales archaeon]